MQAHLTFGSHEGPPPMELADEKLEALLRKIVSEVVAQQVEKVVESAVQRALITVAHRPRIVHDLTPVSDLPLPTRIAKALQRMRVKTVAQLTAMDEEEILFAPNLGDRSLSQLKQVLGLFGRGLSGPQCPARRTNDSATIPL